VEGNRDLPPVFPSPFPFNCPDFSAAHCKNKKAGLGVNRTGLFYFNPGDDLRSHTVARAVSSARRGLTSVFGMGTGVTLAV
jgi:hypothetical protein